MVALPALSDATVEAALHAWDATPTGSTRSLRVALGFTLADSAAALPWSVRARSELFAVDLPASGPTTTRVLGPMSVRAALDPLPALPALAGVAIGARAFGVSLDWTPGSPLGLAVALEGATVTATGAAPVALGDLRFPGAFNLSAPDLGLGLPAAQVWPALRLILSRLAWTIGGPPGGTLAGLLGLGGSAAPGLPPDFPQLPLPDPNDLRSLIADPVAVLRGWLTRLVTTADGLGADGTPHVVRALNVLISGLVGELPAAAGPAARRG